MKPSQYNETLDKEFIEKNLRPESEKVTDFLNNLADGWSLYVSARRSGISEPERLELKKTNKAVRDAHNDFMERYWSRYK